MVLWNLFAFKIDAVVEVATPEDEVVLLELTHLRESDAAGDLSVVGVTFIPLRLSGSKVTAQEAHRSVAQDKTDGHAAFVARSSAHARLDAISSHVPHIRCQFRPDEYIEADANQLDVRQQSEWLIARQDFLQLSSPSFSVIVTGCHYVGCVQIHYFFKAHGVDVC